MLGKEWKTVFWTRERLYEKLVMSFELTKASASFQNFINNVLARFFDKFVMTCLDKILIHSDDLIQHQQHVRSMVKGLQKADLHLIAERCEFQQRGVTYLGLIIGN